MAEELIDSYVNRAGVKEDTDFILKELNKLYDSFKKLDSYKFDLNKAQNFSVAGEAVKKLKIEMDELQRIELQLIKTYEKRQAQTSDQAKDLVAEKELLRQKNLELKNTVKENLAVENSIDALRAKLNNLNAAKNKLNIDTSEYKAAEKEVLELTNKLKGLEGAAGDFRRNVGNYSGALKTLEKGLQDVRAKMDEYTKSGKVSQATLDALTREEALLTQLVGNQANGFASATMELRNNEKALQSLNAAGLQATDFYRDLLKETAELKDNVGDLKEEIKNLASDTSTLDGLIQGAELLAGSYAVAQGAAALFGEDNENLQKTFVQLQAVMTVLNGLQAVRNALQSQSSLMLLIESARTKAAAAAQVLYAFATNGSTAAMKAFRVALLLTGVGALVVLLGAAAQAMGAFGKDTTDATGDLESFNETVEFSKGLVDSLSKSLDFQNKVLIEKAKQRGASDKEITDLYIKGIKDKKKANEDEIKNLQEKYASITTQDKDYKEKSDKLSDEILARRQQNLDYDREITLKGEEFKTKVVTDATKKREDDQKAADAKAKEYREREARAQFDLIKLSQEAKIKAAKEGADNEYGSLTERTAARMAQFEAERTLAIAQRDFELSNDKLTASERVLIKKQADAAITESERQTAADIIAIRQSVKDKEAASISEALAATDDQAAQIDAANQKSIEKGLQAKLDAVEFGAEQEAALNLKAYENGTISKEQYEKKKKTIEDKAHRDSLIAEIEQQEKLVKLLALSPDAEAEALKKLAALKKQLREEEVKGTEDSTEKITAEHEKRNEKLKELGNELKETAFAFLTAGIENEKNKTQEQIDALEAKKQKDIEVANQSIGNAQERAAAIQVIEARAAAQREQLEKRKRQLDQERARYERAKNIADIIQSTSIAVVNALGAKPFTPANIALAAIVGAIGAAQIARLLATPIPKYAQGRKGGPAELAIVGDGGKREMIEYASGERYVTPDKPTLTYLPKNAIVHPDADAMLAMAKRTTDRALINGQRLKEGGNDHHYQQMTRELSGKLDNVTKAVKNIPQPHIEVQGIMKQWISSNHSYTHFIR